MDTFQRPQIWTLGPANRADPTPDTPLDLNVKHMKMLTSDATTNFRPN